MTGTGLPPQISKLQLVFVRWMWTWVFRSSQECQPAQIPSMHWQTSGRPFENVYISSPPSLQLRYTHPTRRRSCLGFWNSCRGGETLERGLTRTLYKQGLEARLVPIGASDGRFGPRRLVGQPPPTHTTVRREGRGSLLPHPLLSPVLRF